MMQCHTCQFDLCIVVYSGHGVLINYTTIHVHINYKYTEHVHVALYCDKTTIVTENLRIS